MRKLKRLEPSKSEHLVKLCLILVRKMAVRQMEMPESELGPQGWLLPHLPPPPVLQMLVEKYTISGTLTCTPTVLSSIH